MVAPREMSREGAKGTKASLTSLASRDSASLFGLGPDVIPLERNQRLGVFIQLDELIPVPAHQPAHEFVRRGESHDDRDGIRDLQPFTFLRHVCLSLVSASENGQQKADTLSRDGTTRPRYLLSVLGSVLNLRRFVAAYRTECPLSGGQFTLSNFP